MKIKLVALVLLVSNLSYAMDAGPLHLMCKGFSGKLGHLVEINAVVKSGSELTALKGWEYNLGSGLAIIAEDSASGNEGVGKLLNKKFDSGNEYGVYGKSISGPVLIFSAKDLNFSWGEYSLILPQGFEQPKKGSYFKATLESDGTDAPTEFNDLLCYTSK